jgi:predicted Zn-dependent peptidase
MVRRAEHTLFRAVGACVLAGLALAVAPSPAVAGPTPAVPTGARAVTEVPNIEYERYTLDNGLEVILHPDPTVPLVAIDVWYHVGSGDETPGKSGFAHLFEHMMFQGAKHIGSDVHFEMLRKIGASGINGTTNPDRTNYFEVVPSHHIETAMWLESDRMGYMLDLLNETSLGNQREVVRNERRQRYDNVAYGRERFAVAAALYPEGHPYRYLTIGRHEDIEGARLEDVRDFFQKWYVPSNATLTVAGDFTPEEGRRLVDKWFGSFPKLQAPEHPAPPAAPLPATKREELADPLARLVRLHYVWPSPANFAEGDTELEILAKVLGSRGWGRLHRRLVLDDELAQSVSVYQRGQGFSGEFHIVVSVRPEHDVSEVEPVVAEILADVTKHPIERIELDRVTNQIESGLVWGLEELLSRAERLQYFNHYTSDPGYSAKYIEEVRSRTPEGIRDVAARVLDKPRIEIVTRPEASK